jgi:hypothetical protein
MGTQRRRRWNASAAKSSPVEHLVVSVYTGNNLSGDSEPFPPPIPIPIPSQHTVLSTEIFYL